MIFELRVYDLGIGRLPGYLKLFEKVGYPILSRYARPVGYWFAETGALNRIAHMWAYEDRAERAERRAALYADPDWLSDFIPYALPHLERQTNAILGLERGAPLGHPRAGAEEGRWLYEFADIRGEGPPDPDPDEVARFKAMSGDLSRRLAIRAFADEAAFAKAAPWPEAARAASETWLPVPFSALR
ncbi:MAG: NIPSNAP family protein [Pseudomonadota bacterium]